MAEITAAAVKALRERTDLPMMECKKALVEAEGDAEKAGKRLQKDAEAGKATFVSLLGLDAARSRAIELVDQACAALDEHGPAAETLKQAARFVIARDS